MKIEFLGSLWFSNGMGATLKDHGTAMGSTVQGGMISPERLDWVRFAGLDGGFCRIGVCSQQEGGEARLFGGTPSRAFPKAEECISPRQFQRPVGAMMTRKIREIPPAAKYPGPE